MRSISIKYFPDLKNISGFIGTRMLVSIQKKEHEGWVVTQMICEYKDKAVLDQVQKSCFKKLREVMENEA